VRARELPLHYLGEVPWDFSQALYHAQAELGEPALNILWPASPYVCIGRFQDAERDLDLEACRRLGVPVVRREVGGGAVYLDGGQVFYQLVLPLEWVGRSYDYRALFALGLDGVVLALKRLGVNACSRGANDVCIGARKISGNGAGQVGQAVAVVGNVLLRFNYEAMASVLRVPEEKLRDKVYRSLRENLVTLSELGLELSNEQVAGALIYGLRDSLPPGWHLCPAGSLSQSVLQRARAVAGRLSSHEWVHSVQRPPASSQRRLREGVTLHERLHKAPGGLLRAHYVLKEGRLDWAFIGGDFFADPPSAPELLAQELTGKEIGEVEEVAARFLARSDISLPGVGPKDIAALFAP
jgi:lipoate-protein ligase A